MDFVLWNTHQLTQSRTRRCRACTQRRLPHGTAQDPNIFTGNCTAILQFGPSILALNILFAATALFEISSSESSRQYFVMCSHAFGHTHTRWSFPVTTRHLASWCATRLNKRLQSQARTSWVGQRPTPSSWSHMIWSPMMRKRKLLLSECCNPRVYVFYSINVRLWSNPSFFSPFSLLFSCVVPWQTLRPTCETSIWN
jgi:hypothetical protein